MCLALYRPGGMAIEIAVEIATFFYIVDNRVAKSKLIAPYFIELIESLQPHFSLTPLLRRVCAGLGLTVKSAPLEAAEAHHGGDVCVVFVFVFHY